MKYLSILLLLSIISPLMSVEVLANETSVDVISCKIENSSKSLNVSIDGNRVIYRFGKAGKPAELTLSEDIKTIDHWPWNGIGRYISEAVIFKNEDYRYEIYFSVDKMSEELANSGGISVIKGDKTLASLSCDPSTTILSFFELSDAKQAHGLCWSQDEELWQACSN